MQDNQLSPFLNRNFKGKLFQLGKVFITILLFYYIYQVVTQDHFKITNLKGSITHAFQIQHLSTFVYILALVPINWSLESYKWMLLARQAIPITFREAFKSTLTGLAIGIALPAQLGDTIGRVASLASKERLQTLGAALVSNGAQYYIALLAGLAGLLNCKEHLPYTETWFQPTLALLAFLLILGVVVYTFRRKVVAFPQRNKWTKKLGESLKVISQYSSQAIFEALALAALRYLVFLIQYILTLSLFSLPIAPLELWAPVTVLLLAKTILPALNSLGDLGIRGLVILWIFQNYPFPTEHLITATLLVWIINILSPLLGGVFLLWKHQWKF